jgi:hypothetical protein
MSTHRKITWAAFVALFGLFGLSCGEAPTAADGPSAQPQFAKGGKGGNKGKSVTYPLILTIYGNHDAGAGPVAEGPRILGDGSDPAGTSVYEDGVDGVEATAAGSDGGRLIMRTDQNPGPRKFWVDLRGEIPIGESDLEPPACGTGDSDTDDSDTDPCTGKGYIVTSSPDPDDETSRLAVLWNDDTYQWRLSYGRGCENDDLKPSEEVAVEVGIDPQGNPTWTFVATDQRAWLLRWPVSGNWRKGMTCLGNVVAPFRLRFSFKPEG